MIKYHKYLFFINRKVFDCCRTALSCRRRISGFNCSGWAVLAKSKELSNQQTHVLVQEHVIGIQFSSIGVEGLSSPRSPLVPSIIDCCDEILIEGRSRVPFLAVWIKKSVHLSLVWEPPGIVPLAFHVCHELEELVGVIVGVLLALAKGNKANQIKVDEPFFLLRVFTIGPRHYRISGFDESEFHWTGYVKILIHCHSIGYNLQQIVG